MTFMLRKLFYCLMVCSVCMPHLLVADDSLTPNDFAYGFPLTTSDANGSLFSFSLSREVYQSLSRQDMGDMRLFNASQALVPFELVAPQVSSQRVSSHESIPLFPILQDAKLQTDSARSVEIKEERNGEITSVRMQVAPQQKSSDMYLLDLRKLRKPVSSLEFDWKLKNATGTLALALERSDNLSSWEPIQTSGALVRLSYDGQQLEERTVDFTPLHSKYLRVLISPAGQGELSAVRGQFSSQELHTPSSMSVEVKGEALPGSTKEFVYDLGGYFPLQSLELVFHGSRTIGKFSFYTRPSTEGRFAWIKRGTALFYQLQEGDKTIRARPLSQVNTTDKYWRVELEGKDASLGKDVPDLRANYLPHEFLFIGSPGERYTLATGSVRASKPDFGLSNLASTIGSTAQARGTAVLGERLELGGVSRLREIVPPKEIPWRKYVLWAVLGLIIVVVGWMAMQLTRELKKS